MQALSVPNVAPASEGVVAIDLRSGATLFARNPDLSLAPASNEKLPLTYAALEELGPDYRFRTELLGEGHQDGSVWHGTLVLKGFGDPTLSSAQLARLAAQLVDAGISRVTGPLLGDESWFDSLRTGPGWKASFYLSESPPLSALVVDGDVYEGRLALRPALAAAGRLRRLLRARGVTTGPVGLGTARSGAVRLGEVRSVRLASVIAEMDTNSDNFVAELLLKELGAEEGGTGSSAEGAAVVRRALAEGGIPIAGVTIADGSGLSLDDRLTARSLAVLLMAAWRDPTLRQDVFAALPVAGETGTLRDRLESRPARGAVRAKTGTTDTASALSGYAHRRYAFAVVQNGDPVSWFWARRAQDRFAQALARGP